MDIQGLSSPSLLQPGKTSGAEKTGKFGALLNQYVSEMNHSHKVAGKAAEELAVHGVGDASETMLALKKAGLSFQLMMAARTKVVAAYQEVMRMQV